MAGTINLALTQQFDMDGNPLSGGLLYFFTASTTTPQNAFQDIALTIVHPNPIVLDASGRIPMFYVADGNIKIRLANKAGVTVIAADNLLVIGPSTGGGGGAGVDPTTVIATGDIKARFGTGPLGGFVRCNGETIGNAVSGSTERANADCQALFEYLWSTTVLGVFSGVTPNRGATANADWLANKRIATPDLRGRTIAGMDDMGTTAAGRLTATGFGVAATVLGNFGGLESAAISKANFPTGAGTGTLPATGLGWSGSWTQGATTATSSFSGNPTGDLFGDNNDWARSLGSTGATSGGVSVATPGTSGSIRIPSFTPTGAVSTSVVMAGAVSGTISGTVSLGGSGTPLKTTTPTMVLTFYIKL